MTHDDDTKEYGANTLRAEDVLVTAQQLVSVAKMLDQKWGDMDQATQARMQKLLTAELQGTLRFARALVEHAPKS